MKKYEIKGKNIHRGCKDHGPYFYGLFFFENTIKKCNILKKDFSDNAGYNKNGFFIVIKEGIITWMEIMKKNFF